MNRFEISENKSNKQKSIEYIINGECWECVSHAKNNSGYIGIGRNNKIYMLHRYIYELFKSKIPKNYVVMHKCDNRICINPEHLELGTHKDNTKDMHIKERFIGMKDKKHTDKTKKVIKEKSKGFNSKRVKLKEEDYFNIKKLLMENTEEKSGEKNRRIAKLYNISDQTVNSIKNGTHWFSENLGGNINDWSVKNDN